MNNEPVAWTKKDTLVFLSNYEFGSITIQVQKQKDDEFNIPLYTHPAKHLSLQKVDGELVAVTYTDDEHRIIEVLWEKPPAKTLTDEDIAKVVHELNQKANTPERWVTAMQIGAETIIQLRDELRKAQQK